MNYVIIDIESSGINIVDNEILTMYAIKVNPSLEILDEREFTFKPTNWKDSYFAAIDIHGISKEECMNFKDKKESLIEFLEWVGEKHQFLCHSNKQNEKGFYSFDTAFLHWELLLIDKYWDWQKLNTGYSMSTHTLAKKLIKLGKLDIKPTKKEGNKRASVSLSLNSLCDYFKIKLDHHNAKSDTHACLQLLKEFVKLDKDILNEN